LAYDYLVVAPGIQTDWNAIPGLKEALQDINSNVVSNYSYDTVSNTFPAIERFPKGGVALFTHPNTPIKCGGGPMKIMYLMADYLQKNGKKDGSTIAFYKPGKAIFGVDKYRRALDKVVARYNIDCHWDNHLVEVKHTEKTAVFENTVTKEKVDVKYDFLHVSPPMSAPDFLKKSTLGNAGGWVDVDKHTLQHVRYPNIFSAGDCTSLPTAKTGAAVRKQAPVLVSNLLAHMDGQALTGSYNGYSSCPLVTGYGKLILAEFDYDSQPVESFPFDQGQERYSMYALKAYGLPEMYWNGMLRGQM
jgi:sulfide:quinone oxidoreductase